MKKLCLLFSIYLLTVGSASAQEVYRLKWGGSGFLVASSLGSVLVGIDAEANYMMSAFANCNPATEAVTVDLGTTPITFGCISAGGGSSLTIQDEGSALTVRSKLNFIGATVTCADDAGNTRTNCTITSDGVGYDEIMDEASSLTKRAKLNFIGSLVTCVDNAGGTRTDCTFTSDGVGYDQVQDEASNLTKRATINFIGSSVTCVDNAGATKTDCTFTDSTGYYNTVQEEGSSLTQQPTLNMKGAIVTCADDGANSRTNCTFRAPLTFPCDETTDVCWFDDFESQISNLALGAVESNVGDWHSVSAVTGAHVDVLKGGWSANDLFSTAALRFQSATAGTAGGRACIMKSGVGLLGPKNGATPSARGKASLRFALQTPSTLSGVTDHYYIMIGANDVSNTCTCAGGSNCGSHELMFTYSSDVNSGKWLGSSKSSGQSTCDTGVTVAINTIYKMCIVVNSDASQADFYIETTFSNLDCRDPDNVTGTPRCSITTSANIPGGSGAANDSGLQYWISFYKDLGSNQRTMYVDYFGVTQHGDTAR